MATIIVSEKSLAGERISAILAETGVVEKRKGAQLFEFSRGKEQFVTIPLRGHITDVDFPKEYRSWYGVDLRKLGRAKILYATTEKGIESLLKERAKHAKKAIIATDADREGEAIGFEAVRFLKEANPKIEFKRAYFSAITPKDIKNAFEKLQEPDESFADSADARREIDLLWGAVLTRYLSLMSGRTGKRFLSTGRVQGPVLAIIVYREKERKAFKPTPYWELKILCEKGKQKFEAMHKKARFLDGEEAKKVFEKIKDEKKAAVKKVKKTKKVLKKPTPFNTTNFLRAATVLGMHAGEAMRTAESLYLQGYISYPRTDNQKYPETLDLRETLNSFARSKEFSGLVEKIFAIGKIEASAGKESKDHPPIYPVEVAQRNALGEKQWKVYELIVRRFFATLAEDAVTENTSAELDVKGEPFIANGQTILKIGWKEFYLYSKIREERLPKLSEGDSVSILKNNVEEKETLPPARYSQSALIKLMEQLGLGTKATRHEILNKLSARRYIFGTKAIEANNIAFAVIDSLDKYCKRVIEPKMTSELEKQMDEIAAGKKTKQEVVQESRELLEELLDELLEHKNSIAAELRKGLLEDSLFSECPKCSGQLRVIFGKTGKRFLGCTNYPKCTNSYPLPQKGRIRPKNEFCKECGAPVIEVFGGRGRYEMCLDMNCKTKEAWKSKAKKPAGKKARAVKATAKKIRGKKTTEN